jgi:hypothetical protein
LVDVHGRLNYWRRRRRWRKRWGTRRRRLFVQKSRERIIDDQHHGWRGKRPRLDG